MDGAVTLLQQMPPAKKPQSSSTALKTSANGPASDGEDFSATLAALTRSDSHSAQTREARGTALPKQSGPASRASRAGAKPGADSQTASAPQGATDGSQSGGAAPQPPAAQPAAQTTEQPSAPENSGSADAQSTNVAPATADEPQPADGADTPSAESASSAKDSNRADAQSANVAAAAIKRLSRRRQLTRRPGSRGVPHLD